MQSEVRVKKGNFKLYITIGGFVTGLVIFLAIWFRFEVGVILLSVAGVMVLSGGLAVYNRLETTRQQRSIGQLDIEMKRQALRIITAEADKAEFSRHIVPISRNERVIWQRDGAIEVIEPAALEKGGYPVAGLLSAPTIELLPLLDRTERALIKGASDAGKTTLFQHIASRSNGVVIVDPHFAPGIWPDGCRIIGGGRNYGEITAFLDWLVQELDSRYKRRAKGDSDFQPITVIVDEFMSISAECDNAGAVLSAMIRESRKVGFRLFIGSHSELVKPLGLEGAGDVREGLLIVRLYYSQRRQERRATVDDGDGEEPCYIPPFTGGITSGAILPDLVIMPKEEPNGPMIDTGRVLDLFDSSEAITPTAICTRLFGYKKASLVGEIRQLLIDNGRLG